MRFSNKLITRLRANGCYKNNSTEVYHSLSGRRLYREEREYIQVQGKYKVPSDHASLYKRTFVGKAASKKQHFAPRVKLMKQKDENNKHRSRWWHMQAEDIDKLYRSEKPSKKEYYPPYKREEDEVSINFQAYLDSFKEEWTVSIAGGLFDRYQKAKYKEALKPPGHLDTFDILITQCLKRGMSYSDLKELTIDHWRRSLPLIPTEEMGENYGLHMRIESLAGNFIDYTKFIVEFNEKNALVLAHLSRAGKGSYVNQQYIVD